MNSTIISALQSLCCGSVPGSLDKGQISSTPETNAAEAAVKAAFVDAQTTDGDLLLMDLESAYEDIATPMMDSFVNIASAVCGRDFWKEGRTAEKLGLAGKTAAEIQDMVR